MNPFSFLTNLLSQLPTSPNAKPAVAQPQPQQGMSADLQGMLNFLQPLTRTRLEKDISGNYVNGNEPKGLDWLKAHARGPQTNVADMSVTERDALSRQPKQAQPFFASVAPSSPAPAQDEVVTPNATPSQSPPQPSVANPLLGQSVTPVAAPAPPTFGQVASAPVPSANRFQTPQGFNFVTQAPTPQAGFAQLVGNVQQPTQTQIPTVNPGLPSPTDMARTVLDGLDGLSHNATAALRLTPEILKRFFTFN